MRFFDYFSRDRIPEEVNPQFSGEEISKLGEIYDFLMDEGIGALPSDRRSFLSALKERASGKKARFQEYDEIARDPLIVQPIEMMVDDATVLDEDREMSFWIESSNAKFRTTANAFLKKNLEPFLDNVAFSIMSRGEYAFAISRKNGEPVALSPVTDLHHLHRVMDIKSGDTSFFVTSEDISRSGFDNDKVKERPFSDFAHFSNKSYQYSHKVKVSNKEYYVIASESVFTDKLIETYRTLCYLEQGIVKARTAKSKALRVINVDVTGLSAAKAKNVIQYVNSLVNAEESMDKSSGFYEASHQRPGPVTCIMPVRGEKGRVQVEEHTPSADIKEIVDVEYFRDRLLSGLRVPKQFLGYGEETLPGVGSAGSLMRIDVRYARMVKRLRKRIREGIQEIITKAYPDHPEYKVVTVPVSSPEDEERHAEIEQRVGVGQTLFDSLLDTDTMQIDREKVVMMKEFFESVITLPSLARYLDNLSQKKEIFKKKPTQGDEEGGY